MVTHKWFYLPMKEISKHCLTYSNYNLSHCLLTVFWQRPRWVSSLQTWGRTLGCCNEWIIYECALYLDGLENFDKTKHKVINSRVMSMQQGIWRTNMKERKYFYFHNNMNDFFFVIYIWRYCAENIRKSRSENMTFPKAYCALQMNLSCIKYSFNTYRLGPAHN